MKDVRLKWTFNIYTKKDLNGQKNLNIKQKLIK